MLKHVLALVLVFFLISCGSDSGGTTDVKVSQVATSVTITPASATLDALGATTQFSAAVRDQVGQNIPGAPVSWSSSNTSVLTVSSSGLATAVAVGEATVRAASGSVTGTASTTVRQVPTQIEVSLDSDHVSPGATTQASLTVSDARGNAIPSPSVTWTSADPSVATVGEDGVVTAVVSGLVFIKGSVESLSDSTRLSVAVALEEDELSVLTDASGEVGIFTELGGGTHFQIAVEDALGQPLEGATVAYADVGDRALFVVRGPGDAYVPAFLFGPVDSLLAIGTPMAAPAPTPNWSDQGTSGAEAAVTQGIRIPITLLTRIAAQLAVIQNAWEMGSYFYHLEAIDYGQDEVYRGRKCLSWNGFLQHQLDRLTQVPGWAEVVMTFLRGGSGSFFDPTPTEGEAHFFFTAQEVLDLLTGDDLLQEKIDLLGAMLDESAHERFVEVSWEFGDSGPGLRRALGHYSVRTNDRYCGGAIPETITALPASLSGSPGETVSVSAEVRSVWTTVVPGVEVTFSLGDGHGSLDGGGLTLTGTTDADGKATVSWTLPGAEGSYSLGAQVEMEGSQPLTTSFAGQVTEEQDPISPPGPTVMTAGPSHACGITEAGLTLCWGNNWQGELGDGTETQRTIPVAVSGSDVLAFWSISTTGYFTCGLAEGEVPYCWGANHRAQLGIGSYEQKLTPEMVGGGLTFVALDAGWDHACGITENGHLYCWGYNPFGQVGDGTTEDKLTPTLISADPQFAMVSGGGTHTCGLTPEGTAYCWGYNVNGEVGDGTTELRSTPTAVSTELRFQALDGGTQHTCGLTIDGEIYCWGYNHKGQLGDGTTVDKLVPTKAGDPVGGGTWASVSAGYSRTCALATDNTAYCWGLNDFGQVGDGSDTDRSVPTPVSGGHLFTALVSGYQHTCGLNAAGAIFCWGYNAFGQLGDGTNEHNYSPTPVSGGYTFKQPGG